MPYAVVVYEVGGVDFVVVEGAGKDKGNRERVVEGAKGVGEDVEAGLLQFETYIVAEA